MGVAGFYGDSETGLVDAVSPACTVHGPGEPALSCLGEPGRSWSSRERRSRSGTSPCSGCSR
ncbi:hypothetical protein ACFSVJ_09020 [Prauserella oleivorans]